MMVIWFPELLPKEFLTLSFKFYFWKNYTLGITFLADPFKAIVEKQEYWENHAIFSKLSSRGFLNKPLKILERICR